MAITPQAIIDEVQDSLQEDIASPQVWSDANMANYMNNALFILIGLRPHAFSLIASQLLVAGTRQTINGAQLIDVYRNMGLDGSTPGKIITPVPRWQIDLLNEHWHTKKGKSFTEHYSYEPEKSKTTFYVYPPVSSTSPNYIETNVAAYWTLITAANQATPVAVDAAYTPFIEEWMKYEAYDKETSVASQNQAGTHLKTAASLLGLRVQAVLDQQKKLKEMA